MSASKSSSSSRDMAQRVCPAESTDGLFFKQCLGLYLNKFNVPEKQFFVVVFMLKIDIVIVLNGYIYTDFCLTKPQTDPPWCTLEHCVVLEN